MRADVAKFVGGNRLVAPLETLSVFNPPSTSVEPIALLEFRRSASVNPALKGVPVRNMRMHFGTAANVPDDLLDEDPLSFSGTWQERRAAGVRDQFSMLRQLKGLEVALQFNNFRR